jgi:hypothetical protein
VYGVGIETINPVAYDFDFTIKINYLFQNVLKGRNGVRFRFPFLVLVVGIKRMGHKAVQEGAKLVDNFNGGGLPFLSGVVRMVLHEQFPVAFFCFLYGLAFFKVAHFQNSLI